LKKHTQIYFRFFGYDTSDWIPCEIQSCGRQAVDIHHIDARGMGGSKTKDVIENLMALCRICHDKYGDKVQHVEFLIATHLTVMAAHKPQFTPLKIQTQ
jgi:hypothetical protein